MGDRAGVDRRAGLRATPRRHWGRCRNRRPRQPPMTVALLQARRAPTTGARVPTSPRARWPGRGRRPRRRTGYRRCPGRPPLSVRELLAAVAASPAPLNDLLDPWLRFSPPARPAHAPSCTARWATAPGHPEFAPAPYTAHDRRSIYQSMRGLSVRGSCAVSATPAPAWGRRRSGSPTRSPTGSATSMTGSGRCSSWQDRRGRGSRVHGDFHLGQVLNTRATTSSSSTSRGSRTASWRSAA